MSRSQRNKGAAWERAVRDLFTAVMPGATVRRGLGQARSGGEVADVDCPVFWVECKVGRLPNPRAALKQAQEAATPGRIPIAVVKDDRHEPFVALALDDFLDFVKEWWHERGGAAGAAVPPFGPEMVERAIEEVRESKPKDTRADPVYVVHPESPLASEWEDHKVHAKAHEELWPPDMITPTPPGPRSRLEGIEVTTAPDGAKEVP